MKFVISDLLFDLCITLIILTFLYSHFNLTFFCILKSFKCIKKNTKKFQNTKFKSSSVPVFVGCVCINSSDIWKSPEPVTEDTATYYMESLECCLLDFCRPLADSLCVHTTELTMMFIAPVNSWLGIFKAVRMELFDAFLWPWVTMECLVAF